jgi:hypothetical protein
VRRGFQDTENKTQQSFPILLTHIRAYKYWSLVIGKWPRVCGSRTCFPKIWNAIQIAGQGKTEWPNRQGVVAIRQVEIAEDGRIVHPSHAGSMKRANLHQPAFDNRGPPPARSRQSCF